MNESSLSQEFLITIQKRNRKRTPRTLPREDLADGLCASKAARPVEFGAAVAALSSRGNSRASSWRTPGPSPRQAAFDARGGPFTGLAGFSSVISASPAEPRPIAVVLSRLSDAGMETPSLLGGLGRK